MNPKPIPLTLIYRSGTPEQKNALCKQWKCDICPHYLTSHKIKIQKSNFENDSVYRNVTKIVYQGNQLEVFTDPLVT